MRNSSTGALSPVFVFGRQSRSVELITLIVSVLTIAVGFVGNLLLSLTIATSASLRTPMNTFVLSIGLVDLLTSVFLLPLRVFVEWQILANKEIDPTVYGVELFVRTFTDITRLFLMMSLSVERYQSIANPLSVSKVQAKRRAVIMSGMTWTVSIILSGISIRYFCDTVLHQPCLDSTDGSTTNWGNLEVFVEMPLTILSILAIATCYSLIVVILRQQRKKMAGHVKPKMNQVMPVDSGKVTQLPASNGSKVEISETKEKTINIKLNSAQDVQQQNHVKPGDCTVGDSSCVTENKNCSDNIKIDKIVEQHTGGSTLSNTIKELNKVNPDGEEKNDIAVSQKLCNNSFSTETTSNTSKPKVYHENIENIDNGSHRESHEEERKISTSSKSPLINSNEIATENNNCLYEDAKENLENQMVNDTNTVTAHMTQYTSTVENKQACLPLQDTKQSVIGGTFSLPAPMVAESSSELTHDISSSPQKEQPDQSNIQRLNTAQLHLASDNAETSIVIRAQPSLSIQQLHKHQDIQNSARRWKQRHSAQSRASFSKTSPRLGNLHSNRLQSVLAFLHARDRTHNKDKTSNNNTLYSSDTATGFKVIPSSQDNETSPNQVYSFSKQQSLHTDHLTHLTNENPAMPLTSHSQSSLSDFTQDTSSRNTTLQTSLESDLDNAREHLLPNSNKDPGSTAPSCERSSDCPSADDKSTYDNNLSISEIQVSDQQQKTSQLATTCINPLPREHFTENRETKDPLSMPEISIVDSTTQNIPNSLQSNPHTAPGDQKNSSTDKSNDSEQDKSTSLLTTNIDKRVEVVDMDGTVHLQIVNSQNSTQIQGAVCLMNPRNKEQGKRRVELKAALKVGLIVCCFACLWMPLPLSVCILRGTSCWTDSMKVDMLAVFSSLATSTAAIDPILYGLLNPQIRSALQASIYKIRRKVMNYCTK